MADARYRLKDLSVTKVALVPRGANPDADIMLFKSRDPVERATFNEVVTARAIAAALWKIYDYGYDLQSAIYSSMSSASNPLDEVRLSVTQFAAAAVQVLDELEAKAATISDEDVVALESSAVDKLRSLTAKHHLEKEAPVEYEKMDKDDLVKLLKARDAEKPADPSPTLTKEQIEELPEPVKKALADRDAAIAKATADAEAASKAAAEAIKKADEETARRETAEAIQKAKAEYPNLPGSDEEKGAIMRTLAGLPDVVQKAVTTIMKAANEAMAKTFVEVGSTDPLTGSAYQKMEAMAKERMAKDVTLTKEAAITLVAKDNPDLYAEYRQSR